MRTVQKWVGIVALAVTFAFIIFTAGFQYGSDYVLKHEAKVQNAERIKAFEKANAGVQFPQSETARLDLVGIDRVGDPTPTGDPCSAIWEVRFQPLPGGGDPEREILPKMVVTVSTGSPVLWGEYLYFVVTDDKNVTRSYLAPPTFAFAGCHPRGGGSVLGHGIIVQRDGIHVTGTGDLELFVEDPAGSGNYVPRLPEKYRLKK